jgi:hypothetical protein
MTGLFSMTEKIVNRKSTANVEEPDDFMPWDFLDYLFWL